MTAPSESSPDHSPGHAAREERRRRQKNAPAGGRSKSRKVTLTPEQDAALLLKARRLKVSVPRLLVESALADQETTTDRRDLIETLFGLQRLLGNVANNVNQLARKANVEDEFPEAARPVLVQMMRLMKRVDLAVDELDTPGFQRRPAQSVRPVDRGGRDGGAR